MRSAGRIILVAAQGEPKYAAQKVDMRMEDTSTTATTTATVTETLDTLRSRVRQLEGEIAAMRPIVLRIAEARMCRDTNTMIESCPHCSLKRGGEYGYSAKHDESCVVSQARRLGF